DAVAKNVIGEIYTRFERAGLKIVAAKMTWLARPDAEGFYAVHRERPFFKDLVEFMTSGPVMIQVLEGDNAIVKNRDLMGATDPKNAAPGTIRAEFAQSIDANAVHGSDGPETAETEIEFFFPLKHIHSRKPKTSPAEAQSTQGKSAILCNLGAPCVSMLGSRFSHMINLLDFDPAALAAFFDERGKKPFRARQALRWIHHRLAARVEAMTDLARATRDAL